MNFSSKSRLSLNPKTVAGLLLVILVIGYGLFEAYDLVRGPSLVILTPQNGALLRDPLVEVTGIAKRTAKIQISGRQIFAQSDGSFKEPLLLGSGYNIIEVKVEDQFGRRINKKIEVVLE
ncbi:MAG: hypothetical protein NTY66_01545 [Candidatus Vogelbacteria bacterium]|nr:hypothetical protein [Candidatus Vogelbacteria bacterium]